MTYVKFKNRPLNESLPHIMDELINGLPVLFNESVSSLTNEGIVPVNIKETPNAYSLELVAPGFEKKDFNISLEDNILTISTEINKELQKDDKNKAEAKQIRSEYRFRDFKRSFTIDEKIDATTIDASYVNGVLVLNLPKKAEVKPTVKNITIQ
jgi:HSP20 family protein